MFPYVALCSTYVYETLKRWHLHFIHFKGLKRGFGTVVFETKNTENEWGKLSSREATKNKREKMKKESRNSWNCSEKNLERTKLFTNYKYLHFHCNKWWYKLGIPSSSMNLSSTSNSTSTSSSCIQQFLSSRLFSLSRCYVSDNFSISLKWNQITEAKRMLYN